MVLVRILLRFRLVQKQLAFMLGRQQLFLSIDENDCPEAEDLTEIMANAHLNNNFLNLGREVREKLVCSLSDCCVV